MKVGKSDRGLKREQSAHPPQDKKSVLRGLEAKIHRKCQLVGTGIVKETFGLLNFNFSEECCKFKFF